MTEKPKQESGLSPTPQPHQEVFPAIPVCWQSLSDKECEENLRVLKDWTLQLTRRYALDHRVVPPCWPEHGALLEELSALRTGWLTTYSAMSTGDAPLRWHAEFATARLRLANWVARTGCRTGEHRPDFMDD